MSNIINLFCISFLFISMNAHSFCFKQAGAHYNVNPDLLKAIAIVESSLNPDAINENTNQNGHVISRDYGLMQINSNWFSRLSKFHINESNLLTDPCLNVLVGAWVLSSNFSSHGYNWNSIGAYNAGFSQSKQVARNTYIDKVKFRMSQMKNK